MTEERIENKIVSRQSGILCHGRARAAVGHAIEACGGNPVDAVRALIVANGLLEQELADIYAKASAGSLRKTSGAEAQGFESVKTSKIELR